MTQAQFRIGDRVVLPPYGIGVVQGTCQRPLGDEEQTYYQVAFPNTSSRAYVPVAAAPGTVMRAALTVQDMPHLLSSLQSSTLNLPRQWAARHRRVMEILALGDPFELAVLTCELGRWNAERRLPDLDRQALRRAIRLLEQEVQDLNDQTAHNVQQMLSQAWSEN